jgi:sterol 3beta-glucosyltransferase
MMKVAIISVGSRGDLQPFVALGLGLQAAGHEVVIISSKNEAEFVRDYGLTFYALNVDIKNLMESEEVQNMSKGNNPVQFFWSHLKGSKKLKQLMVETQNEIWNGSKDADVLVFHPGMPIAFFIAKELQKISVMANPFPVVPSDNYPSILFYSFPRLGTLYNMLTHFLFDKLFWSLSKSAIKEFWETKVKSKVDFRTSAIQQQIKSGMPILNAYSEILFKSDVNWPKNIHTTGSWRIANDSNYKPSKILLDFLGNGTEPIYVGFGSMKDDSSYQKTIEIIIEAIQFTNQRAIIGLGWNDALNNIIIPDRVIFVDNIPHSWLFPQMKMVIHHGGAGTTSEGITAGKPTIIIPHNADQPAWGKRIYELGVGPKPIKKTNITITNLTAAIQYALLPNIIENANQLGKKLRQENGIDIAVKVIEKSFLASI